MSSVAASDITVSVAKLTITPTGNDAPRRAKKSDKKTKNKKVADSWEDVEVSSDSGSDSESAAIDSSHPLDSAGGNLAAGTQAPPPTPITPNYTADAAFSRASGALPSEESKRPEKTDAVARRMIASALGVKVPKQTEEQKAYDRAMREKERKRRDEERALEQKRLEEAEKAKKAMWED